ncbi:MAG: hypothetical protein ABI042_16750 [Verrucomicrobiota bacterium]
MLEAKAAYELAGLRFENHAVAITGLECALDKVANRDKWLERFPMWDWVGGRTSELSSVGLLPAALQGFDISEMLKGASAWDKLTRKKNVKEDSGAQEALMRFTPVTVKAGKYMVILPSKDRLELLSRYLPQLILESFGKEKDLDGNVVN